MRGCRKRPTTRQRSRLTLILPATAVKRFFTPFPTSPRLLRYASQLALHVYAFAAGPPSPYNGSRVNHGRSLMPAISSSSPVFP